jgi:hypothetical protein
LPFLGRLSRMLSSWLKTGGLFSFSQRAHSLTSIFSAFTGPPSKYALF